MTDLFVIIGPPASGKAAVGKALSELTGFRFIHNHMTAEPIAALFGWGTPAYGTVLEELRITLLERALDQPDMPNIIFTFVWAFNLADDTRVVRRIVELFESRGKNVYFIELLATVQSRKAREGTPLRLSLKPAKHDVARARAFHDEADAKYKMNSSGDFPYPETHLIIDTDSLSPEAAARQVLTHFPL